MPQVCDLIDNGGITSCYLTDEFGNPLDPSSPGAVVCEEVTNQDGREDVRVTLPDGSETILQKVTIRKSGFIVVEVTDGIDTCTSAPIPFCRIENVLLCAPEGTDISCTITDFRCFACIHCQNGIYNSIEIFLDICQDIQVVTDVTVELPAQFCEPRDLIEPVHCPKSVLLPPQCDIGFGSQQVDEQAALLKADNDRKKKKVKPKPKPPQGENICVNTTKVYDWIVNQLHIEVRRAAEDVPFDCEEECTLDFFVSATIDCSGIVSGNITCGNDPVSGVPVTFTANPNIISFDPNPATTGEAGNFFSGITVPNGTPPTDVEITATAIVNGQVLSETMTTNVSCDQDCVLTLNVPPQITCEGEITGSIFCNDLPVEGAEISFSMFPDIGTFDPNPAISEADGTFSTTLTIPPGTPPTSVSITATTTVNSSTVTTSVGTIVSCPGIDCPCKFRLGIDGNAAPAEVEITENGSSDTLNGTINVTADQCFTDSPMCNPAVDNFNVSFGETGTTINFVMGRRIEIECSGNTYARVFGTARATGNVFSGIFEVEIELQIDPVTNIGTWTVFATNFAGETFSTTFTAQVSPQTFIGACEDTP